MPFDEALKRALDSLTRDLAAAADAEREAAAAETRTASAAAVAAAVAEADAAAQRSAATAREEGLAEGHRQGYEAGKAEGFHAGRTEGLQAGRADGFQEGRTEGFHAGRTEGFEAGKTEGHKTGRAEGYEAGRRAGRSEGYEAAKHEHSPGSETVDQSAIERLTAAMRALDRSHSLKDILDTLGRCAALEAQRAAILLVRGTQLRGWRFIGFGAALDEKTGFEMPLSEGGVLAEAVRTDTPLTRDGSEGSAPRFAGAPMGSELIAVPIAVGGQVVAVLYADRVAGQKESQASRLAWRPMLEIMARHAGRALEAMTALRTAQVVSRARS
jgi:flagellar biosynthesis/type III secretory pathway protein FliH